MLKMILILALVGAVLGLIFSRRGEEADGALRGAKTGAKIGCGCGCLVLVLLFLAFLAAASLGYLEGVEFPGVQTPAPSDSGTTTTTLLLFPSFLPTLSIFQSSGSFGFRSSGFFADI